MENLGWGRARYMLCAAKCAMILASKINCAVLGVTELQLEYFAFDRIANIDVI